MLPVPVGLRLEEATAASAAFATSCPRESDPTGADMWLAMETRFLGVRDGPGDGWRGLFGEEGAEPLRCRKRVSSGGGVVDSSGDTERYEFELEGVGARWLSRSVSEPERVSV